MLLRLVYLGVTTAFGLLRLLPGSGRDTDAEIATVRHQIAVLQRQLGARQTRFEPADRAVFGRVASSAAAADAAGSAAAGRSRPHPHVAA